MVGDGACPGRASGGEGDDARAASVVAADLDDLPHLAVAVHRTSNVVLHEGKPHKLREGGTQKAGRTQEPAGAQHGTHVALGVVATGPGPLAACRCWQCMWRMERHGMV